jgi:hypothetical protein
MAIPFYPLIFALYPALDLLAENIDQVTPITLVRPLVASVVFSILIWLLAFLLLRNWQKSALLAFSFEVAFFTFGHLSYLLQGNSSLVPLTNGLIYLGLLELAILVALGIWLFRTRRKLQVLTSYLMAVTICLVIIPLARIGQFYWTSEFADRQPVVHAASPLTVTNEPDIYYIVLDAYSRQDLLEADFNFDNRPFIDQLSQLGFDVVPCSRSNYNGTAVSLSSMLNLEYLSSLGIPGTEINSGSNPETPFIKKNLVRTTLEQFGYRIYTFQTDYPTLDWENTTQTFSPSQASYITQNLLPIETLFIKSTALDLLMNIPTPWTTQLESVVDSPYADHLARVRYTLSQLPGTATLPGPKFVYAHIILPHRPFVFDAQGNINTDTGYFSKNGSAVNWDYYQKGYIGQIQYTNSQIIPALNELLHYSQKPPIIILMGDHGYQSTDTYFQNLLAIYLPNHKTESLYPSLSLVNVFRLIFDQYFGADYPLLPDVSYRIDLKKGYILAPETLPGCMQPQK